MARISNKEDRESHHQRSLGNLLSLCTRIMEKDHRQIQSELASSDQILAIRKIPAKLFGDSGLTALETISKYLKEECHLTYHQIANILQRDDRTIWSSYNNARKKQKTKLRIQEGLEIPLIVYKTKKLTVLESTILFLKNNYLLPFEDIAFLLKKSKKTVWATYSRATKKSQ